MTMRTLNLTVGHVLTTLDGRDWVIDTGSPISLGASGPLRLGGRSFEVPESALGLSAETLSGHLRHPVAGLIGTDILNRFDIVFDLPGRCMELSEATLDCDGVVVRTSDLMGVPMVDTEVSGRTRRACFDTGAQIGYFDDAVVRPFPDCGRFDDFYPLTGDFQTDTRRVELDLAGSRHAIRCGVLPDELRGMLRWCGAEGIVSNEVMHDRRVGYFPRRNAIVLGSRAESAMAA